MCTRFACKLTLETVEAFFSALADLSRPPPPLGCDFALGETIPVLPAGAHRTLTGHRWGWPMPQGGLLANARAETLATKPFFARHTQMRRCAVPATGFYEKRSHADPMPWFFSLKSAPVFGLAGLMNSDGEVVLLTTASNARVRPVHRRMPVILRSDFLRGWLNPRLPFLPLSEALREPWPTDDIDAHPPPVDEPSQPELF